MAICAIVTFVVMLVIALILFAWRDWEVLWVVAFEGIQAVLIVYYIHSWQAQGQAASLFPLLNLLGRPAIISLWVLILIYSGVRLSAKWKVRHAHRD